MSQMTLLANPNPKPILPQKVMDRGADPHYSPDEAHQIVMGRTYDESKIYKGGISPHFTGGNAGNTVQGPASLTELVRALKMIPS